MVTLLCGLDVPLVTSPLSHVIVDWQLNDWSGGLIKQATVQFRDGCFREE